MTYGPIAQTTMETFTLQLKKLAAVGNSVAETVVQDTVVLHRAARLLSVKVVAGSVTSDPQVQIHKGVNPDTDGRLLNSLVDVAAANTVYSGSVNLLLRDLDAETKLTLRVVDDAGDDISLVNVVMEFLPLGEVRSLAQSEAKAELDMSTVNAQMDNVLQATKFGADGNNLRVKMVGDSAAAAGVTIDVSGDDMVIHFEAGVSTQGDVNTAITALTGADDIFGVKTAGNEATFLEHGRSLLDMDTDWGDPDTIVRAGFLTGAAGDGYQIATVADGLGGGAGTLEVLTVVGGLQLLYHFQDGVTTVLDFETALAALTPADFEVDTAGTPAKTFAAATDQLVRTMSSGTAVNAENDYASFSGGADSVQ